MNINTVPAFDVRNAAQAVEALPYLLSYQPDGPDGTVFVLAHDTMRDGPLFSQKFDLPDGTDDPHQAAHQMMHNTLHRLEEFATGPAGILLYLCASQKDAGDGYNAMSRHQVLADALLLSAEAHGVDTLGVIFVTPTHWWFYHHENPHYRVEGMPVDGPNNPGVVTMNARAAGIPTPPSEAKILAAFEPVTGRDTEAQQAANVEAVGLRAERVRSTSFDAETERLTAIFDRLLLGGGDDTPLTDLTPEQTAELIVGLRHRPLRDIALGYSEPSELPRARELWALLTRCASDSTTFAAAPLTLAGYAAAVAGEIPAALIALDRARTADPRYLLAKLLMEQLAMTGSMEEITDLARQEREARLRRRDR
ncbi:DUF4192 domain-containing protein [Streptomyces sp. CB01881]|uniref:DUF4192 domain-containing protein n=1 Tax=Streptomyces sp. CB01881 TaxID=2078691 RepID=UPI000CDCC8A2|nr:DUF4192 domain-containing protein [Streptomyces sp. CB01881]AUY50423.1 hypothetical protein C2142_17465 [Streptomyces sp. CB01881]TYC73810.1 DUF4192 domain-containing protein [Streptomyces sp. CB01881]